MAWTLVYIDEVADDVREAKTWYEEQQPGLEDRFAGVVKEAIDKLQKSPKQYSIRYRNVRTIRNANGDKWNDYKFKPPRIFVEARWK